MRLLLGKLISSFLLDVVSTRFGMNFSRKMWPSIQVIALFTLVVSLVFVWGDVCTDYGYDWYVEFVYF